MIPTLWQLMQLTAGVCLLTTYAYAPVLLGPNPTIAIAVWVVAVVAWVAHRDAIHAAWQHKTSHMSTLQIVPALIGVQALLDHCVPHLGDAVVLFGQLAVITVIVRASPFPRARVLRMGARTMRVS